MVPVTKEVSVVNFSGLKARHAESLQQLGLTNRAIDILSEITVDWIDGIETPAAVFRRDHRRDSSLLRSLEDRRFISAQSSTCYEPQFSAFCAMLAGRKRIADCLFREMRQVVRQALNLLNADPMRTVFPYSEFSSTITQTSATVPALRLLSSSGLGIYYNSLAGQETLQVSEEAFNGKDLLAYVSDYLSMLARSNFVAPSAHGTSSFDLGTFSVANLQLVEEAHKHAIRAVSQHRSEPDAAISAAKAALESSLKYIAHREGVVISPAVKLPELFKACRQYCGLGSDASHKMGRSIASLCTEIAEARNLLGDSHGRLPGSPMPTRSEARFVVGIALQLADCLLERYEAVKMASTNSH